MTTNEIIGHLRDEMQKVCKQHIPEDRQVEVAGLIAGGLFRSIVLGMMGARFSGGDTKGTEQIAVAYAQECKQTMQMWEEPAMVELVNDTRRSVQN